MTTKFVKVMYNKGLIMQSHKSQIVTTRIKACCLSFKHM